MEELGMRLFPMYHNPDTVFLEEEYLYTSLSENGMFHQMANSYLIECSLDGVCSDADQVTLSVDRGKESALATIVKDNGQVEKKPLYPEGIKRLQVLRYLKQKVDSGVDFLTTQMFFDNDIHYNFLYRIREAGINVPVLPGIMPVSYTHLFPYYACDKNGSGRCGRYADFDF